MFCTGGSQQEATGKEARSCIHKCQPPRVEHDREVETMDLGRETENIAIINILYDYRKLRKKSLKGRELKNPY